MDRRPGRRLTTERIDRELRLADGAIEMLLTGDSTRVVVGGLRFGEELLPEVRRHAAGTGVSVTVLQGIDDGSASLVFRREPA